MTELFTIMYYNIYRQKRQEYLKIQSGISIEENHKNIDKYPV